jgi:hypothetical protein
MVHIVIKRIVFFLVFTVLAGAGFLSFQILTKKEALVPEGAVDMEFPLKDGEYFVSQSGPDRVANVHIAPHERYALDIEKTQSFWAMFTLKRTLESDPIFGDTVYSPCEGVVKDVRIGMPDQPIGKRDPSKPGNFVTIACGEFMVRMFHFKQNTIEVKAGDFLKAGDRVGLVGNSGNTTGPHLHITAYREIDRGGEAPLPITFSGRYLLKDDYWPE